MRGHHRHLDAESEADHTQVALATSLNLTGDADKLPLADIIGNLPGLTPTIVATATVNLRLRTTVVGSGASVPSVLNAQTVSTHGATPGAVMPPNCGSPAEFLPKLPAAATTVMP